MVEGTTTEGAAAKYPAEGQQALLAPNATPVEIRPQLRNAAEGEVLPEDQADAVGLLVIDHELAILDVVTERDGAAHPHALAARGRKLVADALARELPLELSEGEQDIEG